MTPSIEVIIFTCGFAAGAGFGVTVVVAWWLTRQQKRAEARDAEALRIHAANTTRTGTRLRALDSGALQIVGRDKRPHIKTPPPTMHRGH